MNLQRIPRWLVLGLLTSTLAACDFDFDKDDGIEDDGAGEDGNDDGDDDEGDDEGEDHCGDEGDEGEDPGDPGDPGYPGDSCGPDSVPPPDPNVLDGLVPNPGSAVIADCDVQAGYEVSSWRATNVGATKLWVGGVYQTRGDHSGGYHPVGEGFVSWSMPGSNVLVVSSYEPTHWTLELAPGGQLERIVAIGYHVQTVDAPEGVIVETYALEAGDCVWSCGFALPGEGGGCEGEELVAAAEHVTGLELYAFDGCYDATTFTYAP